MGPIGFNQVVALGSLAVAAIVAIAGFVRNGHSDAADAQRMVDKLDMIASDVTETRDSVREISRKIDDHSERITRAEQRIESIFKRLERLEGNFDDWKSKHEQD